MEKANDKTIISEEPKPLVTYGTFMKAPVRFVCDRKCNKAWGINSRPHRHMSNEEILEFGVKAYYRDFFEIYYSDSELDDAPTFPGTVEGECIKPLPPVKVHNKWCVRECERCQSCMEGEPLYIYNRDYVIPNIRADILIEKHPEMVLLIKEEDADVVKLRRSSDGNKE